MDYYLSSQLIEPEKAQAHYSEKLIQLNTLPTCYEKPALPKNPKTRQEFSLPETGTLYGCPQVVFKFHPDFDPLLIDLLRQDPNGILVLLEGPYPGWLEKLCYRLQKQGPDVFDRIRILPRQQPEDYLSLLSLMDVLLDPLPFGGGNTTYEAMAIGTPIITLPGKFMRGRITAACYRKMGVTDCIADNPEGYVQKAIHIATRPDLRQSIQSKILQHNAVLYEDRQAVKEFSDFLKQAVSAVTIETPQP